MGGVRIFFGEQMNSKITPETGDALLVVDVQNDFLPGGVWEYPMATLWYMC